MEASLQRKFRPEQTQALNKADDSFFFMVVVELPHDELSVSQFQAPIGLFIY